MTQLLPKILPVNELKNTANIMKTCKESDVPIVITKNGYGEAVMMSLKLYEEMFAKLQAAVLINAGLDEIESGAKPVSGEEFFNNMKAKMGNKLKLQIFPAAQADMEQIFEYIAFELKNPSAAVGQITDF